MSASGSGDAGTTSGRRCGWATSWMTQDFSLPVVVGLCVTAAATGAAVASLATAHVLRRRALGATATVQRTVHANTTTAQTSKATINACDDSLVRPAKSNNDDARAKAKAKQQLQQQKQRVWSEFLENGLRTRYVGYARSVYSARNYTPNQPTRVPSSRAMIDLRDCDKGCLEDLDSFSHAWLVFVFHDNESTDFVKSKILPPRKPDRRKVGVFSCRSPNRPNPIGLSIVRIEHVDPDNRKLLVSGVDILEGTPILDIKPYIPIHDQPGGEVRVPEWIAASSALEPDFASVEIDPKVLEKLRRLPRKVKRGGLYQSPEGVVQVLSEILRWDGRKRHIRQMHDRQGHGEWLFEMLGMDFSLEYPAPGVVHCTDVHPIGVVHLVDGRIRFRETEEAAEGKDSNGDNSEDVNSVQDQDGAKTSASHS
ncbi:tRNA adenine37-N6-methyltransferase [Hondaea fermentalgiana]|uniref:tRNA adenine37-N6-methyltransferase n=1 Tax=Hondaea fermentalgiana TaxID=2315210 RepID=A0A2R5GBH1_9STRA|nr:tRNA adenine37-N6-methyltransferase [Hondaea fermentalgiana]|eukprot:GBG28332.1 tRNA adenine37-N6-methyltransferase [Hondaea fermentalgiana]